MTLDKGTRLGPYEIVAPIGAGGMGEVYRARDTRLDRTVAVKILPAELAGDARLRARFEREAKAISALSHPHICALYDVGPDYLVMEHCEGKTLAQRLSAGPLPLEQVLDYGIQIADALDKAHRQGIIHRDLKPSNIMVTKSGVKLLDFGLAKQQIESSPAESTVQKVTEEGKILGTIQYMAPELFNGKEADARSDIFAFGLVVYEMVTGRPAFRGDSRATLIASILRDEPKPAMEIVRTSPPALDRAIRTCLVKDPDERVQRAHDVKLQLQAIAETPAASDPIRSRRIGVLLLIAVLAVIGGLVIVTRNLGHKGPRQPLRRYSINLPADAPLRTSWAPFALSRDGKRLAYVTEAAGNPIAVRAMDTGEVKRVVGTEGGHSPFFSPDGEWIGFSVDDGMKKVPVAGGTPILISKNEVTRGVAWMPGDTIVFGQPWLPLSRVPAWGGKLEVVRGSPPPTMNQR